MGRVHGDKKHLERLRRLRSSRVIARIGQAIFAGAVDVQARARFLISEGAVSGKNHVASEPGEAPNYDTGHLSGNIEAVRTGPVSAQCESRAEYALALEKGAVIDHPNGGQITIEARPYMGPAVKDTRKRIIERVHNVVEAEIRRR